MTLIDTLKLVLSMMIFAPGLVILTACMLVGITLMIESRLEKHKQ